VSEIIIAVSWVIVAIAASAIAASKGRSGVETAQYR
jgi:hypothetical protein